MAQFYGTSYYIIWLILLKVGMAIFARPAGTQSGPTLMGRILPGPIRNRVGYGFFLKKKPEAGPGWVRVL